MGLFPDAQFESAVRELLGVQGPPDSEAAVETSAAAWMVPDAEPPWTMSDAEKVFLKLKSDSTGGVERAGFESWLDGEVATVDPAFSAEVAALKQAREVKTVISERSCMCCSYHQPPLDPGAGTLADR